MWSPRTPPRSARGFQPTGVHEALPAGWPSHHGRGEPRLRLWVCLCRWQFFCFIFFRLVVRYVVREGTLHGRTGLLFCWHSAGLSCQLPAQQVVALPAWPKGMLSKVSRDRQIVGQVYRSSTENKVLAGLLFSRPTCRPHELRSLKTQTVSLCLTVDVSLILAALQLPAKCRCPA